MAAFFRDTYFGRIARTLYDWEFLRYNEEHQRAFAESYYLHQQTALAKEVYPDTDVEEASPGEWLEEKRSNDGDQIYVVNFFGPNDSEHPRNWSLLKKIFVTLEICFLTVSVYMAGSLWSSSTTGAVEHFGISEVVSRLGTSLFLFGLALGPMVFSPISETPSVGKSHIYIPTLFLFIVLQLPIVLSDNIVVILIFRFITGILASPTQALSGGSISDMWDARKLGYPMILYDGATGFGTFLGPVFGNLAAQYRDYTWPIWISIWFAGSSFLCMLFFLPETDPNHILYLRARRLRAITANNKFCTEAEEVHRQITWGQLLTRISVKPIALNFQEPIVMVLNLYLALVYALIFAALESFEVVYVEIYGFTSAQEGLTFLGPFIGFELASVLYFFFLYFYQERQFSADGKLRPEERLIPAFVTAFATPVALFWFGWTSRESIHWIVPAFSGVLMGVGSMGAFAAILNYLADGYPDVASTVLAGNCFVRSMIAGVFPLFITQLYRAIGPEWASSIWAFIACLFIPVPFILYRHGSSIRLKSKNARKDF